MGRKFNAPPGKGVRMADRARAEEASGDWMIRPLPADVKDALGRTGEERDAAAARDITAEWWRKQVADLERAARERGESVQKGTEGVLASQARVFGALGVPTDVAAALMGMSEPKFVAVHGDAYGVGSAAILAQVSANLLRIATSGNDRYAVKAAIEIMNRRGGEPWRPPAQKIEVERTDTKKAGLIDSSKLTAEERESMRKILLAAAERESMPALEHDGDSD